jgi:regulator of chromosome condensation
VFVVGTGVAGELGLGEDISVRKAPAANPFLNNYEIVDIVAGGMHAIALTRDNKVRFFFECSVLPSETRSSLTNCDEPASFPIPQLYSWGCNDNGALGRKTDEGDEYNPGLIEGLEGVKVVKAACGDSISACISEDGKLYSWGSFKVGFLALSSFSSGNKAWLLAAGGCSYKTFFGFR